MPEESTRQESFRLPTRVIEFVEGLAQLGIFGTTRAEIFRYFVTEGVNQAIKDDIVKKTLEARRELAQLNDSS